jgi:hypothetical protein
MRTQACIAALMFFCATAIVAQAPKEEPLYPQLSRGVIRLEHNETIQPEGAPKPIERTVPDGTGFFVACANELCIVTARHVADKGYDLHARVQSINDETGQPEVVLLKLPRDKWVFHNVTGDQTKNYVDVAAMRLFTIKDHSIKYFNYVPPGFSSPDKNQLPEADPDPPRPLLVFGFPADIGFELLEQRPLGRLGIISMKTEKEFIKIDGNKYAEERCMLIDARLFPGNSGSPVMSQPGLTEEIALFGLVIASNNTLDFGVIEPVSRIREVLDLAKKKPPSGEWFLLGK